MKHAKIKAGNDNRHKAQHGAKTKWEDLTGLKKGTIVELISQCDASQMAVIKTLNHTQSPCGQKMYRPGARKLVSLASIETTKAYG